MVIQHSFGLCSILSDVVVRAGEPETRAPGHRHKAMIPLLVLSVLTYPTICHTHPPWGGREGFPKPMESTKRSRASLTLRGLLFQSNTWNVSCFLWVKFPWVALGSPHHGWFLTWIFRWRFRSACKMAVRFSRRMCRGSQLQKEPCSKVRSRARREAQEKQPAFAYLLNVSPGLAADVSIAH